MKSKFSPIFFAAVIFIYAAIALFGMQAHSSAMEYGMIMKCPFMNEGGSLCQADPVNYLTHWLIVFAVILSPLLLCVFAPLLGTLLRRCRENSHGLTAPPLFLTLYRKHTPNARLFNAFIFLFSRGILHARMCAS